MKKYVAPEIEFLSVSLKDILLGSEVLIDASESGLYSVNEHTGEPDEN